MLTAAFLAFVYVLAGLFFYSLAKVAGRADQRDSRARAVAEYSNRRAIALKNGEHSDRMTIV